ncbi:MAG: 50S ribosomal protein L11 methyltransferase [Armatimonadetes bacterium]|nr:50S ribosomal protein L11 methyltransferase [Armatimonadota bacterium]
MANAAWLRLTVEAPDALFETIAGVLADTGAIGSEILSSAGQVVGYYPLIARESALAAVQRFKEFPELGLPLVGTAVIDQIGADGWERAWKRFFRSRRFGRIRVQPPWSRLRPGAEEILIVIEPGMAFGTGGHPTTSLCLELLSAHVRPGMSVLDLGTGTGILALAAAKLGAGQVLGVDDDPIAVEIARQNCAQNGVSERVEVIEGDGWAAVSGQFDLIVCNIITLFHLRTAGRVAEHLAPGGLYIASGISGRNWRSVENALASNGLRLVERRKRRTWTAGVFSK